MSTIAEALALPISPGVAKHVWQAHEEQIERNKREQGTGAVMRGELKWTIQAGYQFTPDPEALDVLMDRIAAGTWNAGVKVTLTL